MTLQHRPHCALLAIPQPDRVVKAATGQRASIRTPGQGLHPLGMLLKRLQTASAGKVPQLQGAIPACAAESAAVEAPAGQRAFVRAEGEAPDSVRVGPPDQVQAL